MIIAVNFQFTAMIILYFHPVYHTIPYPFSLGKSVQVGKGAMRLTLCEAPTRETRPHHYTRNSVPYSLRQVCGFFNVPWWLYNTEDAGNGAYDLSSLSEKPRTSNQLETSRTAVRHSTNWANWLAVELLLLPVDSLETVSYCPNQESIIVDP